MVILNFFLRGSLLEISLIRYLHFFQITQCYFEKGLCATNVYLLDNLSCDHIVPGPAMIIDKNSTIVVEPDCTAAITGKGGPGSLSENLLRMVATS